MKLHSNRLRHLARRWIPLVYLLPFAYLLTPVLWTPIDHRFYNYFHSKLTVEPWRHVIVIGIDQKSVEDIFHVPVYPFSRHKTQHAKLTARAAAAGVRALVFDLQFSEELIGFDPTLLAGAFRDAGNVFLSMSVQEARQITSTGEEITSLHAAIPNKLLRESAIGVGAVNVQVDSDGYLRRFSHDPRLDPLGIETIPELLSGKTVRGSVPVIFPSVDVPIPIVSYRDVLKGEPAALASLNGRIAFVGSVIDESTDFIAVPRQQVIPDNGRGYRLPGVVALAAITENLLQDLQLRDAGRISGLLWVFLWCFIAVTVMPRKHPVQSSFFLLAVLLVALIMTGICYVYLGLIFPFGLLVGSILICGIATTIQLYIHTSKELMTEEAEHARVRREIETARKTQEAFLPKMIPVIKGIDLWGTNISSQEVSGDYYDIIERPDSRSLIIAIADVSGKGLPAALLMSNVHAGLHSNLFHDCVDLKSTVRNLNRLVCENTEAGVFVTFFVAELSLDTYTLHYIRAGHDIPYVVTASGEIRKLTEGSTVLGLLTDIQYEAAEFELSPGDVLCLYTDGVTEARSDDDEEFGLDRLVDILQEFKKRSAEQIGQEILRRVESFTHLPTQADDITLLVVRIDN